MARLCERPTCGGEAAFAYGFDVERRIVWLDSLGDERFRAGALCRRHADRLTVPRGWWLEDRRTPDSLFEVEDTPVAEPAPPEPAPPPKPRARRKKTPAAEPGAVSPEPRAPEPAAADPAAESSEPAAERPEPAAESPDPAPEADAAPAVTEGEAEAPEPDHQWEPAFASVDPDPGVDATNTPLLAKAFGHDAPQPGPRRRPRRPRAAPDAAGTVGDTAAPEPGDPPVAGPVD